MRNQPAVFLDRDGVINRDSYDYVKSWAEFHFRPEALAALRRLHQHGVEVYVVSNQSGVGRGYFAERTLLDIFTRMRLEVAKAGGLIHGVEYCPHRPDEGCYCRKPGPGQLLTAAAKYGLDLPSSVLVGDSCGDINAAHAAGCGSIFLTTRRELPARPLTPNPAPLGRGERENDDTSAQAAESPAGRGVVPPSPPGRGAGGEGRRWLPTDRLVEKAHKPKYMTQLCRQLRADSTPAETRLWEYLRDRRVLGTKFRRQHPLGRYVADFYSEEEALVVEIEGGIHAKTREYDEIRRHELENCGLTVLCFTNDEVLSNLPAVLAQLTAALTPNPAPVGRGERENDDTSAPAAESPAGRGVVPPSPPGRGAGGEGEEQDQVADHLSRCTIPPDYICEDLACAVEVILALPQFAQP